MLLDVSYFGYREIIDEQALVICVEEKIKEIEAEKGAICSRRDNIDEDYDKLMNGEKISLGVVR